jgi:hypothetical protein
VRRRHRTAVVYGWSCLAGVLMCWAAAHAVQPAAPPVGKEAGPDNKEEKLALPLNGMKLPADAILVICEQASDALRTLPKYYIGVSLEKYQALEAEVERLHQAQTQQPAPINKRIDITGRIKGNLAELTAVFSFETERAAAVFLGCSKAVPTSAELDGETARLSKDLEGRLSVEAPPGDHKITVKMLLPVRPLASPDGRGVSRETLEGFELDLALAPITVASVELPPGVQEAEVNDGKEPLQKLDGNRLEVPLQKKGGTLKVVWKRPVTAPVTPVSLSTVTGQVTVRLSAKHAETVAKLTLKDDTGSVKEWQLQLPDGADVRVVSPNPEMGKVTIRGNGSRDGRVTLIPEKPSTEPLVISVTVRQPQGSGSLPVGPFAVRGAALQSGDLTVEAGPNQLVHCAPYQSAGPLEVIPQPSKDNHPPKGMVAAFRYWSLPKATGIDTRTPWFRLEVESVQGVLSVQLEHTLRLASGGKAWHLNTTVNGTPVRVGVTELQVEWPPPWQFDRERSPASIMEEPGPRPTRFVLSESLNPFKLELEATSEERTPGPAFSPVADHAPTSAIIKLPVPQVAPPHRARDAGGHRIVVVVPDDLDVRGSQPDNRPALELISQEAHRIEWRAQRFPREVRVAWRPYRPEIQVNSVADVTLTPHGGDVVQRLQLAFAEGDRAPGQVLLRVPRAVNALQLVSGGRFPDGEGEGTADQGGNRTVVCVLDHLAGNGETVPELVLSYHFAAPAHPEKKRKIAARASGRDALLPVPLVSVIPATHGQARVRIWAASGSRVSAAGDAWEEVKLEAVAGEPSLPALVLRGLVRREGPWPPLILRREEAASLAPTVRVDRALVQARVAEGGFQHYRARFLLRYPDGAYLDLAFPGPPATLDMEARLDGRRIPWTPLENPSPAPEGEHLVRLRLPALPAGKGAVLEITYQLVPGRTTDGGALRTTFRPVTLPGLLAGAPTRWQIDLPASWMPLPLDPVPASSWRWDWRGWLLAPRPAVTAGDLDQWFREGSGDRSTSALSEDEAAYTPSFVCWRGAPASLTLYHVPQQTWLLACSVGLLLLGLVFYLLPVGGRQGGAPNRLFWPLLALCALLATAAGLIWPGLLGAILYGAQPGIAVLLFVLLVQWLVQERYRRRVVFLPGFRRLKTNSSLIRNGDATPAAQEGATGRSSQSRPSGSGRSSSPSAPRRSEPSTVDEPRGEPAGGAEEVAGAE